MTPDQHNQVAHLATYITDDGMIASHCGVTRDDVRLIRLNTTKPPVRRFTTGRSEGTSASSGNQSEARARIDAETGSKRLLTKMQRVIYAYAAKHGLDDFTAAVELQNCKVR